MAESHLELMLVVIASRQVLSAVGHAKGRVKERARANEGSDW